jgi:transcription antitermination factor NusG
VGIKRKKFWYAVETHFQQEGRAKRELTQQGYVVEYPLVQTARDSKGVRAVKPLFEGYVFVKESAQWRSINGTRGVKRLMMIDERTPGRVLDSDLQYFRDCEDDFGYFRDPSVRVFRPGDCATPRSGRFAGLAGEFVKMTNRKRCELLYWMFGRAVTSSHLVDDLT